MKISLISDFKDYYDFAFHPVHSSDLKFVRMADSRSMDRRTQFQILAEIGFGTPEHGLYQDLVTNHSYLVVYFDEFEHRGEGKGIVSTASNRLVLTDKYASQYIDFELGKSYRLLYAGHRLFYYEYESTDWRSNVGDDVEISSPVEIYDCGIFGHSLFDRQHLCLKELPMFAIDFVKDKNGKMLAIDFNTAPGLKWTGMENLLSPSQVYDEVQRFLVL